MGNYFFLHGTPEIDGAAILTRISNFAIVYALKIIGAIAFYLIGRTDTTLRSAGRRGVMAAWVCGGVAVIARTIDDACTTADSSKFLTKSFVRYRWMVSQAHKKTKYIIDHFQFQKPAGALRAKFPTAGLRACLFDDIVL